jgi:hypothetical protein
VVGGWIGLHLDAGMIMGMSILVSVHRAFIMHMHHTGDMTFAGQAISGRPTTRQREGQRRREYAKQINQGDQPTCPPPQRSGQPYQHECFNVSDRSFSDLSIIGGESAYRQAGNALFIGGDGSARCRRAAKNKACEMLISRKP